MPHQKKAFLAILTQNEPFLQILRSCTVVLLCSHSFQVVVLLYLTALNVSFIMTFIQFTFLYVFPQAAKGLSQDMTKPAYAEQNRIMILNDSGHTSLNPCQRGGAVLHQRSHTEFSGCSDGNEPLADPSCCIYSLC